MRFLLALAMIMNVSTASAETYEVRMLSRGASGPMVYEPAMLALTPGDSVRFIAAQRGHNAASIPEMLPAGAKPFIGKIDEEITIRLDAPGIYGIKCSPHYAMGMVMLITVGDVEARAQDIPQDLPRRARTRFEAILATSGK
ncbi:pseudoazurin [Stappia sp. ICDLI1TA098]